MCEEAPPEFEVEERTPVGGVYLWRRGGGHDVEGLAEIR